MKKLYVGNLPYSTTEEQLEEMFAEFGTVHSAIIIKDRMTNRSKGFGFVELDEDAADAAISGMDGKEVEGRSLKVAEARPPREPVRN